MEREEAAAGRSLSNSRPRRHFYLSDAALISEEAGEVELPRLVLQRDSSGVMTGLRCDRLIEMVRTQRVAPWA